MIAHLEAVARGWYPHWRAVLRGIPDKDFLLLAAFAAVFLVSAWTLHRAR